MLDRLLGWETWLEYYLVPTLIGRWPLGRNHPRLGQGNITYQTYRVCKSDFLIISNVRAVVAKRELIGERQTQFL